MSTATNAGGHAHTPTRPHACHVCRAHIARQRGPLHPPPPNPQSARGRTTPASATTPSCTIAGTGAPGRHHTGTESTSIHSPQRPLQAAPVQVHVCTCGGRYRRAIGAGIGGRCGRGQIRLIRLDLARSRSVSANKKLQQDWISPPEPPAAGQQQQPQRTSPTTALVAPHTGLIWAIQLLYCTCSISPESAAMQPPPGPR